MNRTAAGLVVTVVLCACACSSPSATPTPSPVPVPVTSGASAAPHDWIVYQPAREQGLRIARTDLGGSYYQVDGPAGVYTNPDWSPDGSAVIFTVSRGAYSAVWQVGADGGAPRQLLRCVNPCMRLLDPSFDPSGVQIALATLDLHGRGALEAYRPATGGRRVIATAAPTDFFAQPRFSPEGDRLVAELVHRSGATDGSPIVGSSLVVVDVHTGVVGRALTDPELFAEHSDWADSGVIVFDQRLTADSDATDVFTIRPDGSGLTRLTQFAATGGSGGQPSMTPDGRVLLDVQATATAEYALMTVDVTGRHIAPAVAGRAVAGVHARMATVR